MSEIDVSKYFKNYRNEYGLTFAIEYIGNPKDLIREIKQQNELLISYKEENEELKTNLEKARVMNPYINCKNCKKEQKLKKVEDRIQDIKFDDEHNIEIMNDILQIIEK